MSRKQVTAASVAVTVLVAAGITAIEKYRLGHKLTPEERDELNWLVKWLHAARVYPSDKDPSRLVKFWARLQMKGFLPPDLLAALMAKIRDGDEAEDGVADFAESVLISLDGQPEFHSLEPHAVSLDETD